VAEYDREAGGLDLSVAQVQVRPTDGTRLNAQEKLAGFRLRVGELGCF
jgi:hypothetical protein